MKKHRKLGEHREVERKLVFSNLDSAVASARAQQALENLGFGHLETVRVKRETQYFDNDEFELYVNHCCMRAKYEDGVFTYEFKRGREKRYESDPIRCDEPLAVEQFDDVFGHLAKRAGVCLKEMEEVFHVETHHIKEWYQRGDETLVTKVDVCLNSNPNLQPFFTHLEVEAKVSEHKKRLVATVAEALADLKYPSGRQIFRPQKGQNYGLILPHFYSGLPKLSR